MEVENKVVVIFPEYDGDQVKWTSLDELENGFVQQIGELIEHRRKLARVLSRSYTKL